MKYKNLGNTDTKVSEICLGTMTWGEQNTEYEAHSQLDMAIEHGVNFIDAAEMYPVPPKKETQGLTEEYLVDWIKSYPKREDLIIATKVTGPSPEFDYIRNGNLKLDKKNIESAIDSSLKRLKTDYIDLYQLHWPERQTNFFGRLGYIHRENEVTTPIEETLEVLAGLKESGKIKNIGISNESAWGLMKYIDIAKEKDLPRVVSIQNPYSLLNRTFEVGLAECAVKEECGLLAYSPLAFGALSGKYLNGNKPHGARLTIFTRFQRYTSLKAEQTTSRYVAVSKENNLDPAQMALAYVNSRPFTTSTIIGATTLQQLKSNLDSANIELSDDVLQQIEKIHSDIPNPCP